MILALIVFSFLSAISIGLFIPGRGCGTITPIKVVSNKHDFGSLLPCTLIKDLDVLDETYMTHTLIGIEYTHRLL